MENTYVIAWKAKVGGCSGQGTKRLTRAEAGQLADELNQDHPNFIHEPFNLQRIAAGPETETATDESGIIRDVAFAPASSESDCSPVREAVHG